MADYNSDRTGSNIDAVLDKADNLTQAAVGVGGNVGIGTASPSAKLDVAGGDIRLNSDSSAASGSKSLQFWRDNNERGRIKFDFSNSSLDIQADGVMAFKTAGENERARIDSSGNLLVGTTSTSVGYGSTDAGIALRGQSGSLFSRSNSFAISANRNGTDGDIVEFHKDGATVGSIGAYSGDLTIGDDDVGIRFDTGVGLVPWDLGANSTGGTATDNTIDIGASSARFKDLYLSGQAYANYLGSASDTNTNIAFDNADVIRFTTGASERARIDGLGNLLFGKTALDINVIGHQFLSDASGDYAAHTSQDTRALLLNRKGSDGEIVDFRKNGATVGSIAVQGSNLLIDAAGTGRLGSAGVGYFQWDSNQFYPAVDNARDLGFSTFRWDDIYATNGTINTSDRNEKQDIEVLNEAEQRVAQACKGLLRKFRWKDAVAEKGDDARIHFGIIAQDLRDAFTAEGLDAGRYAMFISTTWTDEETDEERTRLGVRYSELLAFIISAL